MFDETEALTRLREHLRRVTQPGHALPGYAYSDDSIYHREAEAIFHNDWVFACMEAQLADPGAYYAFDLAAEPVLVIRGDDGGLRAVSNVCRHRGTPLMDEGFGTTNRLICPYHAWTYATDGSLKGIPHPGRPTINRSAYGLCRFSLCVWQGLVFVSLGAHPPDLTTDLSGIGPHLVPFDPNRFVHPHAGNDETWAANWKIAYENAAESYHLFKVHKDTLETITPTKRAAYLAGGDRWTLTQGSLMAESRWLDWLSGNSAPTERYLLVAIPPGFVAIVTQDAFAWINVRPDGPQHCRVQSGALAEQAGADSRKNQEFVAAFFAEDQAICERVQRGMRSGHSVGGPLVELEQILIDFQRYLQGRLFSRT